MRLEGATRVGAERIDKDARDTYIRRQASRDKLLFKPTPEQRWCYQCGCRIMPGDAYRQHGPMRRVPGQDAKSNYVCWQCPWAGALDAQAVLDSLTPDARRLAQLWAAHIDQRHVTLTRAWHITSAHFDFHSWWSSVELLVSSSVLRIPVGVDGCMMPPAYVRALI